MIIELVALVAGLFLMVLSSEKVVEHSEVLALLIGIPPLLIGLFLLSVGTDLPEIVNSIVSSATGHGDINVGNALGSCLAQISLILGLLSLFGGTIKAKRRDIVFIGGGALIAAMLSIAVIEDGFISRANSFFLVVSWLVLMLMSFFGTVPSRFVGKSAPVSSSRTRRAHHVAIILIGLVGVSIGAYTVVWSITSLSLLLKVPEYIISFFGMAIGTSLPELVVDVTAIRKKQYGIAIGDIIGSNIVDATLSIGIGPLIRPIAVSASLASTTGGFMFCVSVIVISLLALREKVDKKAGAFFILLYLASYLILST